MSAVKSIGLACLLATAVSGGTACAQEDGGKASAASAALVRVRLPLTGADDTKYVQRLERTISELVEANASAERPVLVLELSAGGVEGVTAFERALGVARFLTSDKAASVRTLAYAPESLTGHAVLIALACEEIALAPDARFGAAAIHEDPQSPIEPGVRALYEQIALARKTAPRAVVVGMIDRREELLRVETDRGVRLVLASEFDELELEETVISQEIVTAAGELTEFTGRSARNEGVAQYLVPSEDALARTLGLAPGDLLEGRPGDKDWRPVVIDVAGAITQKSVKRIEGLIATELTDREVNWIGLRLSASDGDPAAALRLAQTLAEMNGDEVRTVAYVPKKVEGPAALVALACDQLVMQQGAELSGAEASKEPEAPEAAQAEPGGVAEAEGQNDQTQAVLASIRGSLAPETNKSWSLLSAVIDPSIEVTRYTERETGVTRDFSPQELAVQKNPGAWRVESVVKKAGEPLRFDATRGQELSLVWREVASYDELVTLYGFEQSPPTAEASWAVELVEALASPGLAALLLLIAVVGLYIELSTPGIGLGGFIATVAFVLFFWSKFLDGTADWLEVLLFVTGMVFVLIEIVVLPGFGVFGLGGGLLVIASLVLAGQTFLFPKTPSQLEELRNSLMTVTSAAVGCLVAAFVLRQYLPRSPLFRHAMLAPPDEADRIERERREALADYAHLVGRVGVAVGDLLPGGRAEIDGELVDVIAEGDIINRGDEVEVVAAHANRVLVRRARS